MSMIEIKQFNGVIISPKDDAIMYDAIIGESGILTGCDLTSLGSGQVRISAGRGIIKGRQFVVQEHTINVELSSSGTVNGRIRIHMDLADSETPVSILTETASTLTALVQEEDCNETNGIYEIELGTYTVSSTTITSLVKTITQITVPLKKSMVIDDYNDAVAATEDGIPVGAKVIGHIADIATEIAARITDMYTEPAKTLAAGSTTITFNSSNITTSSMIDIYTSVYGVSPTAVSVGTGYVTITFPERNTAMTVKVRVS